MFSVDWVMMILRMLFLICSAVWGMVEEMPWGPLDRGAGLNLMSGGSLHVLWNDDRSHIQFLRYFERAVGQPVECRGVFVHSTATRQEYMDLDLCLRGGRIYISKKNNETRMIVEAAQGDLLLMERGGLYVERGEAQGGRYYICPKILKGDSGEPMRLVGWGMNQQHVELLADGAYTGYRFGLPMLLQQFFPEVLPCLLYDSTTGAISFRYSGQSGHILDEKDFALSALSKDRWCLNVGSSLSALGCSLFPMGGAGAPPGVLSDVLGLKMLLNFGGCPGIVHFKISQCFQYDTENDRSYVNLFLRTAEGGQCEPIGCCVVEKVPLRCGSFWEPYVGYSNVQLRYRLSSMSEFRLCTYSEADEESMILSRHEWRRSAIAGALLHEDSTECFRFTLNAKDFLRPNNPCKTITIRNLKGMDRLIAPLCVRPEPVDFLEVVLPKGRVAFAYQISPQGHQIFLCLSARAHEVTWKHFLEVPLSIEDLTNCCLFGYVCHVNPMVQYAGEVTEKEKAFRLDLNSNIAILLYWFALDLNVDIAGKGWRQKLCSFWKNREHVVHMPVDRCIRGLGGSHFMRFEHLAGVRKLYRCSVFEWEGASIERGEEVAWRDNMQTVRWLLSNYTSNLQCVHTIQVEYVCAPILLRYGLRFGQRGQDEPLEAGFVQWSKVEKALQVFSASGDKITKLLEDQRGKVVINEAYAVENSWTRRTLDLPCSIESQPTFEQRGDKSDLWWCVAGQDFSIAVRPFRDASISSWGPVKNSPSLHLMRSNRCLGDGLISLQKLVVN